MLRAPDETVLLANIDRTIARPVLMLTAYLDDARAWSREHLGAVLQDFVASVGAERVPYYRTSAIGYWLRCTPAEVAQVVNDARMLWWRGGVRHHYALQLGDGPGAPSCGVSYREIDGARTSRCGHLQLVLPFESSSEDLLQLALCVAHTGAVCSMVAGYGFSVDPWHKASAFWATYRATRRFVGMDVQDVDQMSMLARTHLPGSNWLTLIQQPLMERAGIERDALVALASDGAVTAFDVPGAVLLRAGPEPTLGDRNTLQLPFSYMRVARALQAAFPTEIEYWGGFLEHRATAAYLHRFDQPEGWS